MNETNQKLFDICRYLYEYGIATSDNQISKLMNKSPRYLSWVKASDHEPDIAAMTALYVRLVDIADQALFRREPDRALKITKVAHDLLNVIKEASIAKNYNKRKRGTNV